MISENAYAKVNLALAVDDVSSDGYHPIKTIMAPIDLYDILTFAKTESNIILLDNSNIKTEENIVYKAAKLFMQTYKITSGVIITLEKRIPQEAGLAGGSADAAATLRGLNRLFELDRPLDELAKLSISLGSDIAYCIYNKLSLCTGRGTEIKVLDIDYPKWNILLVKPPFGCSTKEIYKKYKKVSRNSDQMIENIIDALKNKDIQTLKENMFNDLETPAFELFPNLARISERLNKIEFTMMSGSGSTLYIIDENATLKEIKSKVSEYLEVFQTKLL